MTVAAKPAVATQTPKRDGQNTATKNEVLPPKAATASNRSAEDHRRKLFFETVTTKLANCRKL